MVKIDPSVPLDRACLLGCGFVTGWGSAVYAAEIRPGHTVAIANLGGNFYAIDNTCLHRGGPLGQGVMDGQKVTCPWHGWQFDVTTGKAPLNPAVGVGCYRVEVHGDDLFVEF